MRRAMVVLIVLAGLAVPSAAQAQESEVVTLLRDLVRVDTSDPPRQRGAGGRVPRSPASRPRLRGRHRPDADPRQGPSGGPPAGGEPDRAAAPAGRPRGHRRRRARAWRSDPFGGAISGNYVLGRGALDFKGGLAAFTVAAMRLARSGAPLDRDVILLAEADEEGGSYGTSWLADNHWAKIDAGVSISEGGWSSRTARAARGCWGSRRSTRTRCRSR